MQKCELVTGEALCTGSWHLIQAGGLGEAFPEEVHSERVLGKAKRSRPTVQTVSACRCRSMRGVAAEGGGSPGEEALGAGMGEFPGILSHVYSYPQVFLFPSW